jgi:hypothetical protein
MSLACLSFRRLVQWLRYCPGRLFMNTLDKQYKVPNFWSRSKNNNVWLEGWIRIEVRPIFSLSSLLLLPFCQPYSNLICSPCFTLQKALSSPFPHCSFHLSVNPIFNLFTVLVSPSSKPTLQPFFNFFFHLLANQNIHLLSIAPFTL